MHDEDLYANRVLRAGAMGYINKQEASEEVIKATRLVFDGKVYLSPKMTERVSLEQSNNHAPASLSPTSLSPIGHLSNRELEVFELIGHGKTTSAIAELLNLSIKTIETHRANIKIKLGLKSAGELVRSAVQWTIE
jgi:DNA-binding NarL/FixJ family response regulator